LAWTLEFDDDALKALNKLDKKWQIKILNSLEDIVKLKNPRLRGKALVGDKRGLWRYRVGDYRIICDFENERLVILVLTVAHRSKVYR